MEATAPAAVESATAEALGHAGSKGAAGAGCEMLVEPGFGSGEPAVETGRTRRRAVARVRVGNSIDAGPGADGAAMLLPAGVRVAEHSAVATGEDVVAWAGRHPCRRERSHPSGREDSAGVALAGV